MLCIYCQKASDSSKGRAHIFPEAIVANDVLLERGVVCDSCNQYLGSLDQAVVAHQSMYGVIQALSLPGKTGKLRKELGITKRNNPEDPYEVVIPGEFFQIETKEGRPHIIVNPPHGAGYSDLKFRRALHHVAFNYLASTLPPARVHSPEFDSVRRYIRKPDHRETWPYSFLKAKKPQHFLSASILYEGPGLTVGLSILGHLFCVDMLNTSKLHEWVAETELEQFEAF